MPVSHIVGSFLVVLLALLAGACDHDPLAPLAPGLPSPPLGGAPHADRAIFLDAARTAWRRVDSHYRPATG